MDRPAGSPPLEDPPQGPFAVRVDHPREAFLSRLPVGRHGLPREFIEKNQRNRLMAGALEVFTGRGYSVGSIADVVKAAGVSRNTFYAHFDDKEACFLATYDVVVAWLTEQALGAAHRADGWARGAIAVIDTLIGLLATDPRLARLCTVEVLQAGPPAACRHDALLERLSAVLSRGRAAGSRDAELPPLLDEVLAAGAISAIGRRSELGERERLADLGAELSEALLGPYLGLAAARDLIADAS